MINDDFGIEERVEHDRTKEVGNSYSREHSSWGISIE